jgi:hypothetical protein
MWGSSDSIQIELLVEGGVGGKWSRLENFGAHARAMKKSNSRAGLCPLVMKNEVT